MAGASGVEGNAKAKKQRKMKQIEKITSIVMYILIAIDAVLIVLGFAFKDDNPLADGSFVDIALIWTIVLAGLGVVCALASEGFNAASDPKLLVSGGIKLVAVLAILGIFWAIGDETPLNLIGYEGDENHGTWLKVADMGLFTVYLALAAGVVSIVVSEIYQLFR